MTDVRVREAYNGVDTAKQATATNKTIITLGRLVSRFALSQSAHRNRKFSSFMVS